ncbi:MAG: flagellar biosynthesis protein FlhA [Planctomycetaceae bacterium]|jgi:flagellar biosynthesis protein FlhA|nr:flagellar biosynthesis protein FlhA [Phycisphaerales bacterium]MCE2653752.1 flagellar biosynthesis protein FlhA [Planctomycetaceae bacterium]
MAVAVNPNIPVWAQFIQRYRGLIIPIGFVSLLAVLLVPLPPMLLDLLIVANIAVSVIVLMTTIYMKEPLEFSVFPSLLLGLTLFRLVLNIASTRLILTADANSAEEAHGIAGGVISAFGEFVAGNSLVVGVILFLILVLVQFLVITKGAGRISEIAARFTLDAMPGKQMAIDADLSAGIINEQEARARRERIGREADFFGAMDGASKFVRGDAIAGLIITAVNVVGGVAIGVLDKGWEVGQTFTVFTKLTIGDGLTSQIPALVVSIAAALLVTRSASKEELGTEMTGQVMAQPTGLLITAGFLGVLALTPLPSLPLLSIGAALVMVAWFMTGGFGRQKKRDAQQQAEAAPMSRPEPPPPEALLKLDTLELELGSGLVILVDAARGGDLLERIAGIRRQLAAELGFILPPVRIKDNVELSPTEYRIKVKGAVVARGETFPDRLLAIDAGISTGPVDGLPTTEPAFGLNAVWIDPALRAHAETLNYQVVESPGVVATHLQEAAKMHSPDLLTRQDVTDLVAQLKTKAPKLVEDTIPAMVKMSDLHRILQNLLRERVCIRDLESVLETLADWAGKTKDLDVLTEYARHALRRSICQRFTTRDEAGRPKMTCVTLDPEMEDLINRYIDRSAVGTTVNMPPTTAGRITAQIGRGLEMLSTQGHQQVVLASPNVRGVVRQLIEGSYPAAAVLGYNEVASGIELESIALIGPPPPAAGGAEVRSGDGANMAA